MLFNFTASAALHAKHKRAKEVLGHKVPAGLPENIFDQALEDLLDRRDPWRSMARKRARETRKNVGGTTR
ncbi:MAG: hypothetical protein HY553_11330 [Elusimicrobia bacterium]|nr:hypothetical protein [Elusimicrobiota bacterium]